MSEAAGSPAVAPTAGATPATPAVGVKTEERVIIRRVAGNRRWWRDARRRRMLAVADLISVSIATVVVSLSIGSFWPALLIPFWLIAGKLFGLYDRDHRTLRHLTADEVPALIGWSASIAAVLVLIPVSPPHAVDGIQAGEFMIAACLSAILTRSIARRLWWSWTPPEHVGMLGDQPGLQAMRRKIGLFRDMHFELAVETRIAALGEGGDRTSELLDIANRVDRIIVSSDDVDTDLIAELNTICRRRQVKLSVVSPLRGRALPLLQISQVADLPILEYNTWDASRSSLVIKRTFDIFAAALGLALFALALPFIAIAIKLDSRGPVFFSQIRAGFGGRPFRMYKLRTMRVDAEEVLDQIVSLEELDDPMFKIRDDPRVTRVGKVLRRLSLDEIPQLFNVLVGEMSIVGPRPEQVEIVERYTAEDRIRLTVKPGVTGPMQVFGRGELTFAERMAVELEYIENPSLTRDLRIVLHTIPAVLRGTGAF